MLAVSGVYLRAMWIWVVACCVERLLGEMPLTDDGEVTMPIKIFFSWQVDTPAKEGRNFVLRALKAAQESIAVDLNIEEALREVSIDRDTLDVPGTPPIVDTIFNKIDNATIFIPDLTFAGKRHDGRPTPNPNVLIEYGWALKKLGHSCMLPVMNTAYGRPDGDSMPFDMRHLRHPIQYDCAATASDEERSAARNKLAASLKLAISAILVAQQPAEIPATAPPETRYVPKDEGGSPGKFRPKGVAIGISEGFMTKSQDVVDIGGPAHWLRVMPLNMPAHEVSLADIRKSAFTGSVIIPISSSDSGHVGLGHVRADDGLGLYAPLRDDRQTTQWVVFVFFSGEIWSFDSYIVDATGQEENKYIYLNKNDLSRNLQDYARCLSTLGIDMPVRWEIGIDGVKGRSISIPNDRFGRPRGTCVSDKIVVKGEYYLEDDPSKTIEPFFRKVYEACGF